MCIKNFLKPYFISDLFLLLCTRIKNPFLVMRIMISFFFVVNTPIM